jgi:hypothetical protein
MIEMDAAIGVPLSSDRVRLSVSLNGGSSGHLHEPVPEARTDWFIGKGRTHGD